MRTLHLLSEIEKLRAGTSLDSFSDREVVGLSAVTIPVASRTLGGNEHVPEDK